MFEGLLFFLFVSDSFLLTEFLATKGIPEDQACASLNQVNRGNGTGRLVFLLLSVLLT